MKRAWALYRAALRAKAVSQGQYLLPTGDVPNCKTLDSGSIPGVASIVYWVKSLFGTTSIGSYSAKGSKSSPGDFQVGLLAMLLVRLFDIDLFDS